MTITVTRIILVQLLPRESLRQGLGPDIWSVDVKIERGFLSLVQLQRGGLMRVETLDPKRQLNDLYHIK